MSEEQAAFSLGSIRRRLLSGSAWVLGTRVLGLALGFAMNGLVARLLTLNEFGAFLLLNTMVVIGSTLAELGLDRAVVRFTAESIALGQPGRARASIRISLGWAAIGASAVGLVLALGVGQWFFGSVLNEPLVASVVPLGAALLFATAMQYMCAQSFLGLSRFAHSAVLQTFAADFFTVVVLGGVYLFARTASLSETVALITLVSAVVLAITGLVLLRTMRPLRGPGTANRRELFHVARPLLVSNLGIYLLGAGVDLWILGAFRPADVVALYGASSKLVVLVATPTIIFSGVIPPLAAELYAQGKVRQLERILRVGATLVGVPALLVLLMFIFAGPWVMSTVFTPVYAAGASYLVIKSIGRLVAVWTGSSGIALMMTGHQKDMMWTTILGATLSVGGGLLVTPRYGATGIAIATATAQVVQNGAQLVLARKRLGIWTYVTMSPSMIREILFGPKGRTKKEKDGKEPGPDAE
jgi:O-antigen/teichoic acid export membrane protein